MNYWSERHRAARTLSSTAPDAQAEPVARVLNVSERVANRHTVTRMLRGAGFFVLEAEDSETALARAVEQPDAMVLEAHLQGVDGYETCRRLKASPTTSSIPVMLTSSSYSQANARVDGLAAGADALLAQPFEACELEAALRGLLRIRAAERRAQVLATRLADAVRSRDELLSIASHEIKTPLTSLQLRLDSLARELKGYGTPPQALANLEKAQRQTVRLGGLVEDLLDVARLGSGRFCPQRDRQDLTQLVREVVDRFALDAQVAGCAVTLRASPGVTAGFDRLRMDQVLSNLLANAIKYGEGRPIRVDLGAQDGIARIAISDHGMGIAEADRARVFGRFERAVSARHSGGLGLGLFISRQIVEGHGGAIHLRSVLGEGSTFTVEFPLGAPEPEHAG